MDPFIGQITLFGGSFAIRGWMECKGALLPIAQYTALFSILGTTYGGDGKVTFALPNLEGVGDSRYLIAVEGIFPQRA
jgi:microcystin-dependent protein